MKLIIRIKNRLLFELKRLKVFIQIFIFNDKFLKAHRRWVLDKGDQTLRLNYDLNENSIVFDLGGYKGDFANNIYEKYASTIYIFEPVKSFYISIKNRFKNNDKIKVFNFGLSNQDCELSIHLNADGSSVFSDGTDKEIITLKDIIKFFEEENIIYVDLMKINIEGGEFEVLPTLIESRFIHNITNIQIQFHTFITGAKKKRKTIRQNLQKTHTLTYDYWFIWENWKLKIK